MGPEMISFYKDETLVKIAKTPTENHRHVAREFTNIAGSRTNSQKRPFYYHIFKPYFKNNP